VNQVLLGQAKGKHKEQQDLAGRGDCGSPSHWVGTPLMCKGGGVGKIKSGQTGQVPCP